MNRLLNLNSSIYLYNPIINKAGTFTVYTESTVNRFVCLVFGQANNSNNPWFNMVIRQGAYYNNSLFSSKNIVGTKSITNSENYTGFDISVQLWESVTIISNDTLAFILT